MTRAALFAILPACLLPSCGRSPAWFERDRLQGELTVRGEGLDVRGRLTFARPVPGHAGTLQFDVERDGALDNATLLPTGAMTAFTSGVPRAPTAQDRRLLDVLAAALGWPDRTAERRAAGADVVVVLADGARFTLTLDREAPAQGHHGR